MSVKSETYVQYIPRYVSRNCKERAANRYIFLKVSLHVQRRTRFTNNRARCTREKKEATRIEGEEKKKKPTSSRYGKTVDTWTSGVNTRRMHRSHSTCTFHRTRGWFAGYDDPFFLNGPSGSRRQPDVVDRSRSRPIVRGSRLLYPTYTHAAHSLGTLSFLSVHSPSFTVYRRHHARISFPNRW